MESVYIQIIQQKNGEAARLIKTYSSLGVSITEKIYTTKINGSQVVYSNTITANKAELDTVVMAVTAVAVFTPVDEILAVTGTAAGATVSEVSNIVEGVKELLTKIPVFR